MQLEKYCEQNSTLGNDQCSFRINLVLNTDHKCISEDRNLPKSFPPKYLNPCIFKSKERAVSSQQVQDPPWQSITNQSITVVLFYSSSWLVTQQLSPGNWEKYRDVQPGYRTRQGLGWSGSPAPLPTQPWLLPRAGRGSSCRGGGPCQQEAAIPAGGRWDWAIGCPRQSFCQNNSSRVHRLCSPVCASGAWQNGVFAANWLQTSSQNQNKVAVDWI